MLIHPRTHLSSSFTRRALVVAFAGWLLPTFVALPTRANAPAGRYTFPATGTVFDTKTKLTWQQRVSPALSTQAGAVSICFNNPMSLSGTGWRLPTVKELLTLVDSLHANGLDTAAFPSEPLGFYWSNTPVATSAGYAWFVSFGPGNNTNVSDPVSEMHHVRCVR